MNITIVAYKPDSVDYCRGCIMDRYSSDFAIHVVKDIAGAANIVSDYDARRTSFGSGEYGYDIHILIDGVEDDNNAIVVEIRALASAMTTNKHAELEAQIKYEEEQRVAREYEEQRISELIQLKRLREKYPYQNF